MPFYLVRTQVELEFEVEAENPEQAALQCRQTFKKKPGWWIKLPGTGLWNPWIKVDPETIRAETLREYRPGKGEQR